MKKQSQGQAQEKRIQSCDYPNCSKSGLYRAPKRRDESGDYWHFCMEHVREYNARWDYLAGFSPEDIEKHIRESTVWERPTWPFGKGPLARRQRARTETPRVQPLPTNIVKALSVLELSPPVSFSAVKAQHRRLAKTYHPDARGGSRDQIEKFHALQQAFATLSAYYATQSKRKKNL